MAVTPIPSVQLTNTGVQASSGIAKAHQHGWRKVARITHDGTDTWGHGRCGDCTTIIEQPGAGGVVPASADYFVVMPAGMQAASELGERLRQIAPAMTPYSYGMCSTVAARGVRPRADLHLLVAPGTTVEMIDYMTTQIPSGWGLGTVRFWNPSGTRVCATVENPLCLEILLSAKTFLQMGAKRAADYLTAYIELVIPQYVAGACTFDVHLSAGVAEQLMDVDKRYEDFVCAVLNDPRMRSGGIPFWSRHAIPESFQLFITGQLASQPKVTRTIHIPHDRG